MFTGLIEAMGTIGAVRHEADGLELVISTPWRDVADGESIAVNGACLTVARRVDGDLTFHIIQTSLDRTNFSTYKMGGRVNLERALRVGDRLGGHLVQGHVDGVGTVRDVREQQDARLIDLETPATVSRISVPLGSITVDGVSLTVNALPSPGVIQVSLIPFTLQHTTLRDLRPGDRVHLEADTIGKYVERLMKGEQ
jgi:riboflavin synthase